MRKEGPRAACAGPPPCVLPGAARVAAYNLLISHRFIFGSRRVVSLVCGDVWALCLGTEEAGTKGRGWGQAEKGPWGSAPCRRAPRLPAWLRDLPHSGASKKGPEGTCSHLLFVQESREAAERSQAFKGPLMT